LADPQPELLRLGNNAVFGIDERYVLRLARPGTPAETIDCEVAVARELERLDVPAARLAHIHAGQPLRADGMLATLWDYLPRELSPPSYAAFRRLLREFHQRSAGMRLALPRWAAVSSGVGRRLPARFVLSGDRSCPQPCGNPTTIQRQSDDMTWDQLDRTGTVVGRAVRRLSA